MSDEETGMFQAENTGLNTFKGVLAFLLAAVLVLILTGCPKPSGNNNGGEDRNYRIGAWYGRVDMKASLVMREEPQYWNGAWHVEATIRMDEYVDGTLKGTAEGDLFHWSVTDDTMHPYLEIATGRYDRYSTFKIDLAGEVTESGYTVRAVELPTQLPDPSQEDLTLDFWDFLFPSEMTGNWPEDGSRVMKGESIRPQGVDYRETATRTTFRDFTIVYSWDIEPL
jgi:hypothetical protein